MNIFYTIKEAHWNTGTRDRSGTYKNWKIETWDPVCRLCQTYHQNLGFSQEVFAIELFSTFQLSVALICQQCNLIFDITTMS